jgi:serine/threonine protein kinase
MHNQEVEETAKLILSDANAVDTAACLSTLKGWAYAGQHWAGGMGGVALITKGNERAVLKFTLPELHLDDQIKAYFLRECENMHALHHPNVVAVAGSGIYKTINFFTMEYCAGGSIWDLTDVHQIPMSAKKAVELAIQVLAGLEYAHHAEVPNVRLKDGSFAIGRGLVHRDIKPQNILLQLIDGKTVAKVGDFGLAKAYLLAGRSGVTLPQAKGIGTLDFMSRQQAENFLYAKPEVDVWAVAASLYWMLTGYVPRECDQDSDYYSDPLQWIRKTDPVPIDKRGVPGIPGKLAKLIDRELDDKVALAFQSAAEFGKALQACM